MALINVAVIAPSDGDYVEASIACNVVDDAKLSAVYISIAAPLKLANVVRQRVEAQFVHFGLKLPPFLSRLYSVEKP